MIQQPATSPIGLHPYAAFDAVVVAASTGGLAAVGTMLGGLPADFPSIDQITFVKSEEAGPSRIVEGWGEGDLEDLYNDLHGAFEDSDYKITFDEREDHDAEISFEGGGVSGQVKFADECGEGDRVYVRVTSRPTG